VTTWDIWGTAGAQGGRPLGLGICKRCLGSRGRPSGLGTCKGAWARGAVLPSCAPPGGSFGTPGPRKGGRGEGEGVPRRRRAGARGAEIFFSPLVWF